MDDTDGRLSTGIRFLDMEVGGGIPVGDIVALTTPPDAQSEVLFKEIARVQPVHYISTICPDETELRRWIEPAGMESAEEMSVSYSEPSELLNDPDAVLAEIPSDACVIIDPLDPLEETTTESYLSLLNAIETRVRAVESVAFLNCLATDSKPAGRPLTLKRADHVWQINQSVDGGELQTSLLISKSRGNAVPTEAISIELADKVQIDTSRNIA